MKAHNHSNDRTLPQRRELIDVARVVSAYYSNVPNVNVPSQRVVFGTSGHRGAAEDTTFNEWHVCAIAQAICRFRTSHGITGPLFLGADTHALSQPACTSVLEVLAANGVDVMLSTGDEYTPTPAVSHAILVYNRGRDQGLADGIVITPSHNPPRDGGIKYNGTHGGPADTEATDWIQTVANNLVQEHLIGVERMTRAQALRASTTHRYDYRAAYIDDLASVIDVSVIAGSGLRLGVDPLGGAGVHYWGDIGARYGLNLQVISEQVDPQFAFLRPSRDGEIRMDPSDVHTLQRLLNARGDFDIAFACDPDHDRHGIVTPSGGLLQPNHFLAVAVDYLVRHRQRWASSLAIGKSVVTSAMVDRIASSHGKPLFETPVGFKWFAAGLCNGTIGFAGEESAGASFLRLDGSVWSSDKDGITASLLAAEITARTGQDPGQRYLALTVDFGGSVTTRVEAPATLAQKRRIAALSPLDITSNWLAGERIERVQSRAAGNGAPIGGIKVETKNSWFVARPSGTEAMYRIYAESLHGSEHLARVVGAAQRVIDSATSGLSETGVDDAKRGRVF